MRMNRTVFELIRKNASRERQIDDVSYSGKKDMRAQKEDRKKLRIHCFKSFDAINVNTSILRVSIYRFVIDFFTVVNN